MLDLKPAERDAFFDGDKEGGNRVIVALRGVAAAERFRADLARLQQIRAERKKT